MSDPSLHLKPGTYRHYKGQYYQVVGVAKHSETEEELVVYYCLYPNKAGQLWVRPAKMFAETITIDGKTMPRFVFVTSEEVGE